MEPRQQDRQGRPLPGHGAVQPTRCLSYGHTPSTFLHIVLTLSIILGVLVASLKLATCCFALLVQVVGIRLLVYDDRYTPEGDAEGLTHADLINQHLPPAIRVLAVQKTHKVRHRDC